MIERARIYYLSSINYSEVMQRAVPGRLGVPAPLINFRKRSIRVSLENRL